jgi:hypothetical protein
MIAIVMTVLHLIPGLSTLATGWLTAAYNAKVAMTTARIGGDVTVGTALVNAAAVAEQSRVKALQVIGSSWVLSFLVVGFAVPWIIHEWKVVVWDTDLGWGTTTPVKGDVAEWAKTIIGCLFGSGTVMAAGHMYFNRDKTGE